MLLSAPCCRCVVFAAYAACFFADTFYIFSFDARLLWCYMFRYDTYAPLMSPLPIFAAIAMFSLLITPFRCYHDIISIFRHRHASASASSMSFTSMPRHYYYFIAILFI